MPAELIMVLLAAAFPVLVLLAPLLLGRLETRLLTAPPAVDDDDT